MARIRKRIKATVKRVTGGEYDRTRYGTLVWFEADDGDVYLWRTLSHLVGRFKAGQSVSFTASTRCTTLNGVRFEVTNPRFS